MKAVQVFGPNDFRISEIETPVAGPDDVVVRVAACGICGSDLNYVATGRVGAAPALPVGIGHEASGIVEAVGANVTNVTVGLRVVVNPMGGGNIIGSGSPEGAFAERLLVKNARLGDSLHPISDALSFEHAALVEPLAIARHSVDRAAPSANDRVCVFGAGPIGLGIVHFLKLEGLTNIAVVDMSDSRLDRARQLGATITINPSRQNVMEELGRHHGTDKLFGWPVVKTNLFIEASGAPPVIPDIVLMAPFHARLVVVAVYHEPIPLSFNLVLAKEMTILSSMGYSSNFEKIVEAVENIGDKAELLISHRFSFDQFVEAFETAKDRKLSSKVIVTFPEAVDA